jgi:hypothetical protein
VTNRLTDEQQALIEAVRKIPGVVVRTDCLCRAVMPTTKARTLGRGRNANERAWILRHLRR